MNRKREKIVKRDILHKTDNKCEYFCSSEVQNKSTQIMLFLTFTVMTLRSTKCTEIEYYVTLVR